MDEEKPKRAIDWEGVEREYRAGIRTLRDIGAEYGVSHVAIQKKADKEGWDRDLSARIRAKAEMLVTKEAVTSVVTKVTEKAIVEANAELQANITRTHRRDIARFRTLAASLVEELEAQTGCREALAELPDLLAEGELNLGKLADLAAKVASLPGRADTAKKLAEVLKTLITLERQAFGMKDDDKPEPTGAVIVGPAVVTNLETLRERWRDRIPDAE